ncbi:MAG: hypothetical protein JEZ04_15970 [Spirochaetales bacterium]|nr:hypothetical protein [Spirochaetales bacterium]
MKSMIKAAVAAIFIVIVFSSCQQVFTSSVYFWAEADMSTMTADQKISYAEDLLSCGTTAELAAAFAEIFALLPDDLSTADSGLLLLAADLAVGSSGLGAAITGALEAVTSGGDLGATLLEAIDTTNLATAVSLIAAAEDNGADLSSEQYTNAAASQLLVVAETAGGIDNLGSVAADDPGLLQAQTWAEAGGIDIEALLAGGLPA